MVLKLMMRSVQSWGEASSKGRGTAVNLAFLFLLEHSSWLKDGEPEMERTRDEAGK